MLTGRNTGRNLSRVTQHEVTLCRRAGKQLARAIGETGESIRSAAPLVGCSYSHLSLLLRGERRPGLGLAYAIERYWGVRVEAWGLARVGK